MLQALRPNRWISGCLSSCFVF